MVLPTSLEAFSSCLDLFSLRRLRLPWSDQREEKAGKEGWGRTGAARAGAGGGGEK